LLRHTKIRDPQAKLGHSEYGAASRCGAVVLEGPPTLAKQLRRWLMWSPIARFVRERESALGDS